MRGRTEGKPWLGEKSRVRTMGKETSSRYDNTIDLRGGNLFSSPDAQCPKLARHFYELLPFSKGYRLPESRSWA
jgi:hypothetical protein